jgi:ketosteroid isomerase-like protein
MDYREMREELGIFFNAYAKAVRNTDVKAVSEFWTVPALVIVGVQRAAIAERTELLRQIDATFKYHAQQGIDGVKRTIDEILELGPNTMYVRSDCRGHNDNLAEMVHWKQGYMIQNFEGELKIVMTICYAQDTDWRMTPSERYELFKIDENSLLLS